MGLCLTSRGTPELCVQLEAALERGVLHRVTRLGVPELYEMTALSLQLLVLRTRAAVVPVLMAPVPSLNSSEQGIPGPTFCKQGTLLVGKV